VSSIYIFYGILISISIYHYDSERQICARCPLFANCKRNCFLYFIGGEVQGRCPLFANRNRNCNEIATKLLLIFYRRGGPGGFVPFCKPQSKLHRNCNRNCFLSSSRPKRLPFPVTRFRPILLCPERCRCYYSPCINNRGSRNRIRRHCYAPSILRDNRYHIFF